MLSLAAAATPIVPDTVALAAGAVMDTTGASASTMTDALVAMVQAMWNDPQLKPVLLRALPVAGVSGTLHSRMRTPPLRGNVHAKTGTTNDASALTGFVKNRYAFAIMQNGHPLSYWWARVAQDRFARVLAAE